MSRSDLVFSCLSWLPHVYASAGHGDHRIAETHANAAMVAANPGYDDIKPALGESWKVQANLRIALSCMGPVLRRACLVANTLGPCGACAYYELGVGGPKAVNAPA